MIRYIVIDILYRTLTFYQNGNLKRVLNFYLNILERFLGRSYLISNPIGIDMIASASCNFRCIYCSRLNWEKQKEISMEDFRAISAQLFPTLSYIKFGSATEHFTHSRFKEIMEECHKSGLNIILNTNGSLLDHETIELLFRYRVMILGISLDGAKAETAERIRKGLNFGKLMQSLREINEIKKAGKHRYPILTFNFVAMRSNIEELPEFMDLMHEFGVEKVRVMDVYVHSFMDEKESLYFYPELSEKYFQIAIEKARKYGIRLDIPKPMNAPYIRKECYFPVHEIGVTPAGDVAYCCDAWEKEKTGNLIRQDFRKEIWNNEFYRHLRRTVNTGKPEIEGCSDCMPMDRGGDVISRHFDPVFHERLRK